MEIKNYEKTPKLLHCKYCHYYTYNKSDFNKHNTTRKHNLIVNSPNLEIIGNEKVEDNLATYICSCCNYTTHIKFNYDKHLLSVKHNKNYILLNEEEQIETKHICS